MPRQDLTGADRTWAERYDMGDVLRYSRASKETRIANGTYAHVKRSMPLPTGSPWSCRMGPNAPTIPADSGACLDFGGNAGIFRR